jgi:hypothetical protein
LFEAPLFPGNSEQKKASLLLLIMGMLFNRSVLIHFLFLFSVLVDLHKS